jgi:hypothetical protein
MARKLDVPKNKYGWQCIKCKHWLPDQAITVHITDAGVAVPPQVRDQMPLNERVRLIETVQSFCTRDPAWRMCMDEHWCGWFFPW